MLLLSTALPGYPQGAAQSQGPGQGRDSWGTVWVEKHSSQTHVELGES